MSRDRSDYKHYGPRLLGFYEHLGTDKIKTKDKEETEVERGKG